MISLSKAVKLINVSIFVSMVEIGIDMSEEYINEICIPRLNTQGWNENNKN